MTQQTDSLLDSTHEKWEVQIQLFNGGWENTTNENDKPVQFVSEADADADLADHLAELVNAGIDFGPEEYRVYQVS